MVPSLNKIIIIILLNSNIFISTWKNLKYRMKKLYKPLVDGELIVNYYVYYTKLY